MEIVEFIFSLLYVGIANFLKYISDLIILLDFTVCLQHKNNNNYILWVIIFFVNGPLLIIIFHINPIAHILVFLNYLYLQNII